MFIVRALVVSAVIATLLLLVLSCNNSGADSASTDARTLAAQHTQAAMAQTATAMRAQNEAVSGGASGTHGVIGTIGPGETWYGTITVKLGPESFSLDRSGTSGVRLYSDLQLKLLNNHWQEYGVTGRVHSVRVEQYSFDIWQMEKDGKLAVPSPVDRSLDMEMLGRLDRQEVAQIRWQKDPRLDGFDPEWDLRRGRGSAHRATIALSVTAPDEVVWPKGRKDRDDGDLFFGSQYRQIGLVIGLRHNPSTGGFLIREGSFMGGEVVANPHHARFADAR